MGIIFEKRKTQAELRKEFNLLLNEIQPYTAHSHSDAIYNLFVAMLERELHETKSLQLGSIGQIFYRHQNARRGTLPTCFGKDGREGLRLSFKPSRTMKWHEELDPKIIRKVSLLSASSMMQAEISLAPLPVKTRKNKEN